MADREVGYDTVVKERRGDMGSQKWMLRSNLILTIGKQDFSIIINKQRVHQGALQGLVEYKTARPPEKPHRSNQETGCK